MTSNYQTIIDRLGKDKVEIGKILASYTTFKIGGPADLFYEARTEEELVSAVKAAKELQIPYLILGEGSNLLVGDKGFRGIVIKTQNTNFQIQTDEDDPAKIKVIVGAGVKMGWLMGELIKASASGLEFMAGIPGTVGGAVRGNAGAWQQLIGDKVNRVKILNEQNTIQYIEQKDCAFVYRGSRFKHNFGEIILEVEFLLEAKEKSFIEASVNSFIEKRKVQPKGPSAGCVFINPKPHSAGALIDQCGLKGFQIGGAKISEEHANFIINTGEAKASDVTALIDLARGKVREKFQIDLQEEIVRIGEF
jgi:UDP-N-acetylmuramate dehydrogenase